MNINYYELSINVIISVLFISLFIGAFFFTYGAYIEGLVVKNQMKFLSEDIGGYINLLGNDINKNIKKKLLELPAIDLHEEDDKVKDFAVTLEDIDTSVLVYIKNNIKPTILQNGNQIQIIGGGSATITATQAATANYNSAITTANLTVNKRTPVLSGFSAITKTTDDAYTISISASSTTGSKIGGGVFVTVGPVSLEA